MHLFITAFTIITQISKERCVHRISWLQFPVLLSLAPLNYISLLSVDCCSGGGNCIPVKGLMYCAYKNSRLRHRTRSAMFCIFLDLCFSNMASARKTHTPPTHFTVSQHIFLACLTANVYLLLKLAARDGRLAYPASIWRDGCAHPHRFKLDAICTNRSNVGPVWGCNRVRSQ